MVKAYSITDIGKKRTRNQDYVFTSLLPLGQLPNLFMVADGMGGHNAGGFASKFAVESIMETLGQQENGSPKECLLKAIRIANYQIRQKANEDESMEGMGTTLVAASLNGNILTVANVGDSRLYVMGERIRQITVDHSLVEEMIRNGVIAREQARNHPDKNIITKALGAEADVVPDFFEVVLQPEDIVLLCSDGVSNMLTDKEMGEILIQGNNLEEKARKLVEAANENGGKDNIAVVLVKMSGEDK